EPGAEVHGRGVARHADVAEVAGGVARGDVEAAAERDGEVGEIATHADAFLPGVEGGAGGAGLLVIEAQVFVDVVAHGLHAIPAGADGAEARPGEGAEVVVFAVAAGQEVGEDVVGEVRDR